MSDSRPKRITRYRRPPEPAWDDFTWTAGNRDVLTFRRLLSLLAEAEADGVPGDANVQWGGLDVYLHWHRPAGEATRYEREGTLA